MDYRWIFQHSPNAYMVVDRELRYVEANDAYLRATGSRREDLIGRYLFDVFPHDPQNPNNENASLLLRSLERARDTGVPDVLALIRYRVPRGETDPEGERFWSATHTPIRDENGRVGWVLQHTVDVTELERLRQATADLPNEAPSSQMGAGVLFRAEAVQAKNVSLEAEQRHLRNLFEQAPGFMCVLRGPEHVFELANAAYVKLIGRSDLLGRRVRDVLPEVVAQGFVQLLDDVYRKNEAFVGRGMAIELVGASGQPEERVLDFVYQPVTDQDDRVIGIFVEGSDVTEQYRAQEELERHQEHLEELVEERTAALEASEAALRQSQKMEALGKLTGGVAHDFNNLLQVIGGNLQLLERDLIAGDTPRKRLDSATQAVARGARLASHLLAFARKQPLQPTVFDVGALANEMGDLIKRALGEGIELAMIVSPGLWPAIADRHQLENVVLNLVINARDAMEGSGKLTIEAANATLDSHYASLHGEVNPGQYVMLAISDTGSGMAPDVLERAFEPFFTTKPEGRGTGLGLSMVYGFIRQSGGHIQIYSEVGHGTTIKVYLPRSKEALSAIEAPAPKGSLEGGSETILVVEDDAEVRKTVVDLLTELGYRVLRASEGQSALAILESGVPVDLVFTDVVMPGPLRSPDLARKAKELFPDIEVLFTSGYTENAIVHGGRLDHGVELLSKPYMRDDLARRVRALLDRRKARSSNSSSGSFGNEDAPRESGRALRVLLVEDDEDTRAMVAELLLEIGHEVTEVGSAEAAEELLRKRAFDVLFTDVGLPGARGDELARSALARDPTLRVVLATGYRAAEFIQKLGTERVSVLVKPYDIEAMQRMLR